MTDPQQPDDGRDLIDPDADVVDPDTFPPADEGDGGTPGGA